MNSYAIFDSIGQLIGLVSANDRATAEANCPPGAILIENPERLTYLEASKLWLLRDKPAQ